MGFDNIKDKLSKLEPIFLQTLTAYNVDWENRIHRALAFHNLSIEQLPEYIQVINEMQQEATIMRYDGKLLTVGGGGRSVSLKEFINGFLNWAADSRTAMCFEERFSSFKNYFSKSTVTSLQTCYLFNFQTDLGVIELPNELRIRPATHEKSRTLTKKDHFLFGPANFILEKVTELEIQVSSTNADEGEQDPKEFKKALAHISAAPEAFNHLVNCFHALKPCATYVDGTIYDRFDGYAEMVHGGSSRSHINPNPRLIGESFRLSENELPSIAKYFNLITSRTHKKFALASRRLSFAKTRNQTEDQVLDLCIALEALFLPKSSTELSFRLGMRLGKTLGSDTDEACKIFEFAKNFYGLRSKVAHGEELPHSIEEDVKRAEELLRQSLGMYLSNQVQFSDDNMNRALLE